MKKPRPIHPILFAAFPVLSLFAANLDYVYLYDLWRPLIVMMLVAGLVWLVASRFTKESAKSAAGITFLLIAMFGIGFFKDGITGGLGKNIYFFLSVPVAVAVGFPLGQRFKPPVLKKFGPVGLAWVLCFLLSYLLFLAKFGEEAVFLSGWLFLMALAAMAGFRMKKGVEQATTLLNVVGVILVAQPLITFSVAGLGSNGRASSTEAVASSQDLSRDLPDIYYFVLDGYGRDDVLRDMYGMGEGDPLAAGLSERGFYVAEESRANYTQTLLSIGSTLNMDYVPALIDVDERAHSRSVLRDLTNQNLVTEQLLSSGYQYISVVTQKELLPTSSAHATMEHGHGRTLLEETLISKTPLSGTQIAQWGSSSQRRRVLGVYRNLDSLKPVGSPRFVFVHVVSPHPPFVFNADGSERVGGTGIEDGSHFMGIGGTPEGYVEGYREQAKYIAARTLESIDLILSESEVRPVIIVQGDHGPKSQLDYESLENTNLDECLPILNAYLVPNEVEADLYASVSPVNSFRILFRHLFGQERETLPDRSYYSTWTRPYQFTEAEAE